MAFDPETATAAYIDSLGADVLARAAAYTAGNHWLLLWGLVVTGTVNWLVVRWGLLDRVAERLSKRGPNLRAFAVAAAFASLLLLLAPVLIEPIFNDYKPVPEGEVREALLVMARESGVPTDRIFVYDGSRQSNNFTANVAGLGGSARIAISDVAFKGASLEEVRAVTGHEIGHYVLGHVWRGVIVVSLLAVAFFFLADRLYPGFARAFGSRAALGDPAGLPVLVFVVSLLAVLAQPVFNTLSRIDETEADRYSLETVNLPDALASALVKTAEYRYPRPHPLQEAIFYTHPSVERRVRMAMEWKAAQGGG